VIVNLTVEDNADGAVGRPHGLCAAAEVDDGQAAMTKMDAGILFDPMAFGIRAAVSDGVGHPLEDVAVALPGEARYAAHGRFVQSRSRASFTWIALPVRRSEPASLREEPVRKII
jgi:hypothetical protein